MLYNSSKAPTITPIQTNTIPTTVYVTGDLLLGGSGDTPGSLNFTNPSGQIYSTVVSGETYALNLPNNVAYVVTVGWTGSYSWQKGTAPAGTLFVNETSNAYHADLAAYDVPPSTGQLQGTVNATGITPTNVVLTGATGNYSAPVNGSQFSVQVPNLTTYQVQISWSGGECSAGSIDFYYSPSSTYELTCSK